MIKKYLLIVITTIGLIAMLCGCGVNDATRKELYKQIIKTGDLNLDLSADEYEEIKTVSNAPIPGTTTYYIYRGNNGEKYTFQFIYLGSEDYTYKTKVKMECGNASLEEGKEIPELNIGYEYLFKKGKITKRIKLKDSEQSSYLRRFSENDSKSQHGITSFNLYCGEIKVYFDDEIVDSHIEKLINENTEKNVTNPDVILCTDKGEYKSEDVRFKKNTNGKTIVLTAKNQAEGVPERIEIDGIKIDLGTERFLSK